MRKEILHIYSRVSSEIQEEGSSLDTQKEVGIQISKDYGLGYKIHNEGGKSSKFETWENRPKIQDIMIGMEEGRIKHLYSWDMDRISRNDIFWNTFRTILMKHKISFYTKNGKYSFDNPQDRFTFQILSGIGEYENSLRKLRTHRGKMERVKQGFWMGGDTPYGYKNKDKKLVEDPKQSKWVKFIYESFNNGKSIREIREHLFINGIPTNRGNPRWSLGSIESVLRNTHYSGFYHIEDRMVNETIKCKSPKILDNDIILQTKKKLERRSYHNKSKSNLQKNFYLLKGLIYCKECGSNYTGRIINKRHQSYFCLKQESHSIPHKHENRYIKCEFLDKIIWETTIDTLTKSHHWKEQEKLRILGDKSTRIQKKKSNRRKIRNIELEIQDIENTLTQLPSMRLDQRVKKDILKNSETEIINLKNEKDLLEREILDFNKKDEWIDWISKYQGRLSKEGKKDPKEQREFLNGIIDKIDIKMKNKKNHILDIHYKIPIFEDGYDRTKKNQILEGKRTQTIQISIT